MSIKQSLTQFYDAQATKYWQTRKKHRRDGDRVLEIINNFPRKNIRLLELGCGGGRLLSYLTEHTDKKIDYVGVDMSQKLLQLAKKDNPNATFVHDDMTHAVQQFDQESFDIVAGIAAFQHLPTYKERIFVMKNIYRLLRYEGKVIMLNRALSDRFRRTYTTAVKKAWRKWLYTFGKSSKRDIYVPRKGKAGMFHRYYHLFALDELQKLAIHAGFVSNQLVYLTNKSTQTAQEKDAQNSFLVATKEVLK